MRLRAPFALVDNPPHRRAFSISCIFAFFRHFEFPLFFTSFETSIELSKIQRSAFEVIDYRIENPLPIFIG